MRWDGWGDPAQAITLPDDVRSLIRELLGATHRPGDSVGLAQVRLSGPALPEAAREALRKAVGSSHVHVDGETRVRHTRGKSTPDLLRLRAGEADDAPDAVVLPGSHEEVQAVLDVCAEHRVALVPFGGGTSVVGGLQPQRDGFRGVVALDLRRLDRMISVDRESLTVTCEPGTRAPQAEALLAAHGLTLGHLPQSFEYASLGGFAATRSSGQASSGYGRFDDLVVGLRAATPVGTLDLGCAPASAAGPDLRQVLLGSEGAFGVITSLTLRVRPTPEAQGYEAWRFDDFDTGAAAMRRLVQNGPVPTVLRLSDETETGVGQALGGPAVAGCLVIVGYEGTADDVSARRTGGAEVLREAGGEYLGTEAGDSWVEGRFHGPYLRDSLLDVGVFAETLETATFWSRLRPLYEAVRTALIDSLSDQGVPPIVMCHISHVYPTGASLYFTVACAQSDDPLATWRQAKTAASEAIVTTGGTITHHHGVGRDHRDAYAAEIGLVGGHILRAIKQRLDPAGILNPGILVD